MPSHFFADRIDCPTLGRPVLLSGEVEGWAGSLRFRRLRCSHRSHCQLRSCDALAWVIDPGLAREDGDEPSGFAVGW
nr:hypothetical protein [uncultured Holophaga sp.]